MNSLVKARLITESRKLASTYIHRAAILRRKLARLLRGGNIPGGPGSDRGSCRRRNVSARCSARWLDSRRASPVKSSNVTKSTKGEKQGKALRRHWILCGGSNLVVIKCTVVVGRVLVGRARKLDEGEIGKHLTPPAAVHHPSGRNEGHSGEHGEDFVGGRMDGQDHNASSCRPLA